MAAHTRDLRWLLTPATSDGCSHRSAAPSGWAHRTALPIPDGPSLTRRLPLPTPLVRSLTESIRPSHSSDRMADSHRRTSVANSEMAARRLTFLMSRLQVCASPAISGLLPPSPAFSRLLLQPLTFSHPLFACPACSSSLACQARSRARPSFTHPSPHCSGRSGSCCACGREQAHTPSALDPAIPRHTLHLRAHHPLCTHHPATHHRAAEFIATRCGLTTPPTRLPSMAGT